MLREKSTVERPKDRTPILLRPLTDKILSGSESPTVAEVLTLCLVKERRDIPQALKDHLKNALPNPKKNAGLLDRQFKAYDPISRTFSDEIYDSLVFTGFLRTFAITHCEGRFRGDIDLRFINLKLSLLHVYTEVIGNGMDLDTICQHHFPLQTPPAI